jgi:MFS transporter, ACS family, D-galactonate transporter
MHSPGGAPALPSSPGPGTGQASGGATPHHWRLLVLLVISVFINYIDRTNLAVALTDITQELSLTPQQAGLLASSFFWTYAVCQLLAGWLIDRYNVYWVFAIGYFLWSVATAFTGFANAFTLLLALRLLLGFGESVAYPAFSKIIASSFPEEQRGKANAFIDAGSKVGPALGLMIGGLIVAGLGWRALFLILGFGALLWLPFWFAWTPKSSPTDAASARQARDASPGMLEMLRHRSVWGTFIGLFAINYSWYLLITWFPYYLENARGFTKQETALIGSFPFWLIAVSSITGGWASDRFIGQGHSPTRVRKTFIMTGMMLISLLLPAVMVESTTLSMALFGVACFFFGFTTSNHWAITQRMAGPTAAGKWTGMQNAFGNLAGVVAPWLTGYILEQTNSFTLAFGIAAMMAIIGALSFGFIVGRIEPVQWKQVSRQPAAERG